MNIEQTSVLYSVTFDEIVRGRFIVLKCSNAIILSGILLDDGNGWRNFHPFIVKVEGDVVRLPKTFSAGEYILELAGEQFYGTRLELSGMGLYSIEKVEISDTDSTQGERSGVVDVVAGENSIVFRPVDSAEYEIQVDLFLTVEGHTGERSVAVPLVPPNEDSRTRTGFRVRCDDAGKLYWRIKQFVV